jgi:hypothetical protein
MHLYMKVTFSRIAPILLMFWLVLVIRLTHLRKCGRFHELQPEPKERDPPDLCVCLCGPTGRWYIRSTSVKSPSFCKETFCSSLTKPTALLPQSHDRSCYVIRPILAPPPLRLPKHYAHTTSRTLPTCDVSLGLLNLPAPESGDFVELIWVFFTDRLAKARCVLGI